MVKYIKVTDREYRYARRYAKSIEKTLKHVESENKKLEMYYNVILNYYECSQRKREVLETENAELYTKYYDELYRIRNESREFNVLNEKYIKLCGEYEHLLCKHNDLQKSDEESKVYSGRIL
tara:strand:+ start:1694 stop:2059 length:366 start_codon:yes stop_codon:yes gene_type:complete